MHSKQLLSSKKDCSSLKLTNNRFQCLANQDEWTTVKDPKSPASTKSSCPEETRKPSAHISQGQVVNKRLDLDWRASKSTKPRGQSTLSRQAPRSAAGVCQNRENGEQSRCRQPYSSINAIGNLTIKKLFGKDFFRPGLIIRADLHEEGYKACRPAVTPANSIKAPSGAGESSGTRHERAVHTKERKMIIVACYTRHYICIPLYSHEKQGLKNKNVSTYLSPLDPIFLPHLRPSPNSLENRKLTSTPSSTERRIHLYS